VECLTITPQTKQVYRSVMGNFLRSTEKMGDWTPADVKEYFAKELEAGRSKTYLRFQYTALKPLFLHEGTRIPVPRSIIRPPKLDELNAPALDPDEVMAMIQVARDGRLDPRDVALLAASSIWGFRRSELATLQITAEGFVTVAAAKTGAPRMHLIPDNMWPALHGYQQMPMLRVSERFHVIRKAAKIRNVRGMGWHAVRRAVATALWESGVPGPTINAYMGWAPQSRYSATRYYRPRARDVDQAVYQVHPYLAVW
jgi:integrase